MTQPRLYPRTALVVLTALNLLNYIDRSVLFAVQPLVQVEFHRSDADFGLLTSAFFLFYMFAAPLMGPLADRYSRRLIIVMGAFLWSGATLLTAATHSFQTLLIRHTLVGIGEASFVTISPTLVADLFPEQKRGRILGVFYLAIPVGTALGYIIGGNLGPRFGWRSPFYVASMSVWMPTFLSRVRGYPLARANLIFGGITAFDGTVASLAGGWLGDRLLRRTKTGYYLVSAASMAMGVPVMIVALYTTGRTMLPGILLAEFLLLLNTAPLNAALINSVGAHIRATAIAVNIFMIHLLGDALSPWLIGKISDRSSLQSGFISAVVAIAISSAILFYGMRFAPPLRPENPPTVAGAESG